VLKAHEHYNIEGVIVGQAIYTGQLDPAARPFAWPAGR
jgi:phosphoribosylformimino-5-aminoimidazole carboxamide ribonucleotide (ProFAR) isomerase